MAEENKERRSRWERWKDHYRLVILNDETFEEIGSYKLSLLNVYVALSMMVVLVTIVVVVAIAFTPVKRLIPGYGNSQDNSEMVQLYHDLDSLEQLSAAQERYNEGIRRLLVGEVEYASDAPPKDRSKESLVIPDAKKSEAENQLRSEVEVELLRDATGQAQPNSPVNVSPREVPLEQMYFSPPLSGSISANFDPEKNHFGVDVIAPKNTPVKATMDGWVISSDWTLETGNTIAIQHTNNIVSFYKHNSSLLKKAGAYVRAGEAIAIIGNTGELTDGPHLHFELWHRGKPVNPTDFVNFK
ncbi:MAG: M23 family metallopeptidase [Lewinellaceae bacterium]|nr:M23 family metallopeptidase [Saprospiraceae bacterium]MCB9337721.1 M23 family metallopeptidase [Lewinellaceae bacterium]